MAMASMTAADHELALLLKTWSMNEPWGRIAREAILAAPIIGMASATMLGAAIIWRPRCKRES